MTERRPRPQMPAFVKALVAMMFGILAGGAFNFMLGDQGADTPAFAIYGGVLALVIYVVFRPGFDRGKSNCWGSKIGYPGRANLDG